MFPWLKNDDDLLERRRNFFDQEKKQNYNQNLIPHQYEKNNSEEFQSPGRKNYHKGGQSEQKEQNLPNDNQKEKEFKFQNHTSNNKQKQSQDQIRNEQMKDQNNNLQSQKQYSTNKNQKTENTNYKQENENDSNNIFKPQNFQPKRRERIKSEKKQQNYAEELKNQILEKEAAKKKEHKNRIEFERQKLIQSINDDPFGKQGNGAPIYDEDGNVMTKRIRFKERQQNQYQENDFGNNNSNKYEQIQQNIKNNLNSDSEINYNNKEQLKFQQNNSQQLMKNIDNISQISNNFDKISQFSGKERMTPVQKYRKNFQDSNNDQPREKNLMDKMFDNQQDKIKLQEQFYRNNNSINNNNNSQQRNKSRSQEQSPSNPKYEIWKQDDSNLGQILSDQQQRQRENRQKKQKQYYDVIDEQIKMREKKKKQEKEKQLYQDRQLEDKIKRDQEEIKINYLEEKQKNQAKNEIKSVQKIHEIRRQSNIQEIESKLSSKPKSPFKQNEDLAQNSLKQNLSEQNLSGLHQQHQQQQKNFSGLLQENDNSYLDHSQLENNSQFISNQQQQQPGQQQFNKQQTQFMKENNFHQDLSYDPSLYYNKQNDADIEKLRETLNIQTSMLQNEMRKLKHDAQLALELKHTAMQDLEGLRDQLKRQELFEELRFKELQQKLQQQQQQAQNGPFDYLIPRKSVSNSQQNQQFKNYNQQYSSSFQNKINNQPDILDTLVQSNMYVYPQENSYNPMMKSPQNLDFKLESRLNGINLSQSDLSLVQLDNLLLNLRQGPR